jgi:hypothetical protein
MADGSAARTPATGRYKPDEDRDRPFPPDDHHIGWDRALQKALRDIGWPAGEHEAHVEFGALVGVTNPGHVIEYRVTLS